MKFLIAIVCVLMIGCTATFNPPWNKAFSKVKVRNTNYMLNEVKSSTVGSIMIQGQNAQVQTHYVPNLQEAIVWKGRAISVNENSVDKSLWNRWIPVYESEPKDGDFIVSCICFHRGSIGIIIKEDGTVPLNPVLRIDKKGSTVRYPIDLKSKSRLLFTKQQTIINSPHNLKFELIYSGRTNDTLNIQYREFVDDFARSSFYQALTYNLNDGATIRFRTLEIEIISANNKEIIFRIVKDEGLPWLDS